MSEELCDEAKGMVHWFGVSRKYHFPTVVYIGCFDMGETMESFDAAWNEYMYPVHDDYEIILREDQAQELAIELLDGIEQLTKQRVQGETE